MRNAYTGLEINLFKKLNSPKKIQDYLNSLHINFEEKGETCMSPRFAIKTRKAHCMEGAMLAAAILEFYGAKPWVMDLRAHRRDDDHAVAVFKQFGRFGAISKTNHAVLRFREPIYHSIRELALSFFHEYFDNQGRKTLREYSRPLDLSRFDSLNWRVSDKQLFEIPAGLDDAWHHPILNTRQVRNLRRADKIEIQAGKLVEWRKI